MQIKTDKARTGIPIWQSKNTQVAQGGFTLDDSVYNREGDVVPGGIPICFDESTRLAVTAKYAIAQATATGTATTYKIEKGHNFSVGNEVCVAGACTPKEIVKIETDNADYDTIEVDATLGKAVAVGDAIYIAEEGYKPLTPNGLLYSDVVIDSNGVADIAVVLRGTVYERRIPQIPEVVKENMPLIIFSQSY